MSANETSLHPRKTQENFIRNNHGEIILDFTNSAMDL